jgi:glutamine amidotransferase
MENLTARRLAPAIKEAVAQGKPFLGICLGMQLLLETSAEAPAVSGLGLIEGTVARLQAPKVPQIGWNCLEKLKPSPLFQGLGPKPFVYFVHSYYAVPQGQEVVAATANYQGDFPAAFWQDNIFALQFHPEKSGKVGLAILNNFWKLVQRCW